MTNSNTQNKELTQALIRTTLEAMPKAIRKIMIMGQLKELNDFVSLHGSAVTISVAMDAERLATYGREADDTQVKILEVDVPTNMVRIQDLATGQVGKMDADIFAKEFGVALSSVEEFEFQTAYRAYLVGKALQENPELYGVQEGLEGEDDEEEEVDEPSIDLLKSLGFTPDETSSVGSVGCGEGDEGVSLGARLAQVGDVLADTDTHRVIAIKASDIPAELLAELQGAGIIPVSPDGEGEDEDSCGGCTGCPHGGNTEQDPLEAIKSLIQAIITR